MTTASVRTPDRQGVIYLAAFFMAFCSLCYELLIASRLSRLLGEGIFIYPACIAVFILFMGLGSAVWYRKSERIEASSLNKLVLIEWLLTGLGFFSVLAIDLSLYESLYSINLEAVAVGVVMAAAIGFLSGQELPLLFHFCSFAGLGQRQVRRIIFFDYLASFFASVLCSLVFFSILGLFKTSILISFFNLLLVVLLAGLRKAHGIPHRFSLFLPTIFAFGVYMATFLLIDPWEDHLLKQVYLGGRPCVLVEKKQTPYQQVLLFAMRQDGRAVRLLPAEVLARPREYFFFAVLNGSLQFFEPLDAASDPDHTFLFDPYLSFLPQKEKILILGGGDGLPARQAVGYPFVREITMVDIDRAWVELARTHPLMKMKNRGAMDDPRVKIHYQDAFTWILQSREKFDFIAVDFPSESTSLAKVRTTSVEFLRDLRNILSEGGAAVIHGNTISSRLKMSLQARTAREAGFFPLFGFKDGSGSWSPVEHLVLFSTEESRREFERFFRQRYLGGEGARAAAARFGHLQYLTVKEAGAWISYYDPHVSRLSFRQQLELMRDTW